MENKIQEQLTIDAVSARPVVMIFVRYYLPGYKSGGPVRSIANMVELLGNEIDFHVITLGWDFMDEHPYPGVALDSWNQVGLAKVWYVGRHLFSLPRLIFTIRKFKKGKIYLNSLFDPFFSFLPFVMSKIGIFHFQQIIIAPRGELSPGALSLKYWKKKIFLMTSFALRFYGNVIWHASTNFEKNDIKNNLINFHQKNSVFRVAKNTSIFVAKDLTANQCTDSDISEVGLVFISRISKKKNLDYALRVLLRCKSLIRFDIYGIIEDQAYWNECLGIIEGMPDNVSVNFYGSLTPDEVPKTLRQYSLFFFPTRGENYGHVIAEALAAGLPVLLSDQTPWDDIELRQAGWIRSLACPQAFADVIDAFNELSNEQRLSIAKSVAAYAKDKLFSVQDVEDNRKLFTLTVHVRDDQSSNSISH